MMELGQLQQDHAEFKNRKTRVVVISLEDQDTSKITQGEVPDLKVVSDPNRNLANALKVIHKDSNPNGGDTTAPTTILVDGTGTVRWLFRPSSAFERLAPSELLAAVDKHLSSK